MAGRARAGATFGFVEGLSIVCVDFAADDSVAAGALAVALRAGFTGFSASAWSCVMITLVDERMRP
ncbi:MULTISPECIES: hypothetical protein [Acidiphilium]|uniref:hypothetical protein n=1 Tax=Acidiphilium TaxID=522 RepID=UPI0025800AE3|nr:MULTISPECIES: hypothetical protein [Acidiphilium]